MLTASLESKPPELTAWLSAATQEQAQALAAELRARLREQFLTEGAAYGQAKWLPRKTRNRHLPSSPLLIRTGRLYRSLTQEGGENISIWDPETLTLLLGTAVPYAPYHQFGTRTMPARPILTAELLGGTEAQPLL